MDITFFELNLYGVHTCTFMNSRKVFFLHDGTAMVFQLHVTLVQYFNPFFILIDYPIHIDTISIV